MKNSSIYTPEHGVLVMLLRDLRLEANLSQAEVGAAIGRHQNYLSSIEIGRRGLDFLQVRELVEAYGWTMERFSKVFDEQLRTNPYRPPRRARKDAKAKKRKKPAAVPRKRTRTPTTKKTVQRPKR